MTTDAEFNATKAYRNRVGLVAEIPNFPGPWTEGMEKVKLADELGYDSSWLGESLCYVVITSIGELVRITKRIKSGAGTYYIYARFRASIVTRNGCVGARP